MFVGFYGTDRNNCQFKVFVETLSSASTVKIIDKIFGFNAILDDLKVDRRKLDNQRYSHAFSTYTKVLSSAYIHVINDSRKFLTIRPNVTPTLCDLSEFNESVKICRYSTSSQKINALRNHIYTHSITSTELFGLLSNSPVLTSYRSEDYIVTYCKGRALLIDTSYFYGLASLFNLAGVRVEVSTLVDAFSVATRENNLDMLDVFTICQLTGVS